MFVFQFGAVASQGGEEVAAGRRLQLILFIGKHDGRSTNQRNRHRGAGIGGRYHQQRKEESSRSYHWKLRTLANKPREGRGGQGGRGWLRRTGAADGGEGR